MQTRKSEFRFPRRPSTVLARLGRSICGEACFAGRPSKASGRFATERRSRRIQGLRLPEKHSFSANRWAEPHLVHGLSTACPRVVHTPLWTRKLFFLLRKSAAYFKKTFFSVVLG